MEILWILGLLLVLFPDGVLWCYGWTRWPRRRQTRLAPWHLRAAGLALFAVAAVFVYLR